MRKIFILIGMLTISLALLLSGQKVYSFGGCEEDCQKCHSLDKGEAQQILVKMKAADAKVMDVKMSPIRGLWEVSIDDKGKPRIMYVSFSKKYIMGGTIFEVESSSNKTQETINELNRTVERYVDVSKIPLEPAIVLGDRNARYKVIVFTDPECPFCARLHEELKKVVSERADIAFYLKLMPLKMHPEAHWKSESILCNNSLRLLEDNFEKKPIPKPDCETRVPDENIRLAKDLDITGTPTLIMPDGLVVPGVRDAKTLAELATNPKRKDTAK